MKKTARILLLSPNIKGIKDGINRVQPGLGIAYLAAILEKEGHEVHVRDCALEGYENEITLDGNKVIIGESDDRIAAYISDLNPSIIGISALFSNLIDHAHTIAGIVKQIDDKIIVVLGGNHISNAASDYMYATDTPGSRMAPEINDLEDRNIDFAIQGEAESSFPALVEAILSGKDPSDVPGLMFYKSGKLRVNARPSPIDDLNKLPFPARHLMNMEGYFNLGLFHSSKARSKRVVNVMASRGCPERCTFCTTPSMWGNKLRWRDPKNIYDEIKMAVDVYGAGEIQFEDDSLTARYQNLISLCDLIEPLGIPWCTPNGIRVNYHQKNDKQDQMYKRMTESGCYQVTLACESGSQRVLDNIINKNLRLEQIKPSVESAKNAGLLVHTFWIVGYPGETREEMEQTIEFAAGVGADSYSVAILTPLPGTQIYRQVVSEDLWWSGDHAMSDLLYRNSMIRVDGFADPQEFETWVEEKNVYLNQLLEHNDYERFKKQYRDNVDRRFLLKQT